MQQNNYSSPSKSKYINYILDNPEKNKKWFVTDYYLSKDYEKPLHEISPNIKHRTVYEKLYSEEELIKQRKIKLFEDIHNHNKKLSTATSKIMLERTRLRVLYNKSFERSKMNDKPRAIQTVVKEMLASYDHRSSLSDWKRCTK